MLCWVKHDFYSLATRLDVVGRGCYVELKSTYFCPIWIPCSMQQLVLRCMSTPRSFSAMFSKGDKFRGFLFAYLKDEVCAKWGLLIMERICSDWSKFFPLWDDPNFLGCSNEWQCYCPWKCTYSPKVPSADNKRLPVRLYRAILAFEPPSVTL